MHKVGGHLMHILHVCVYMDGHKVGILFLALIFVIESSYHKQELREPTKSSWAGLLMFASLSLDSVGSYCIYSYIHLP